MTIEVRTLGDWSPIRTNPRDVEVLLYPLPDDAAYPAIWTGTTFDVRNLSIVGVEVDGVLPKVVGSKAFRLYGSGPVHFENLILDAVNDGCHLIGMPTAGRMDGVDLINLTVRCGTVEGNWDGLKPVRCDSVRIADCRVESWGDAGAAVDLYDCRWVNVERCTFSAFSPVDHCLMAKGGCDGVSVASCVFGNAINTAIYAGGDGGFYPTVRGMTVERNEFRCNERAITMIAVDGLTIRDNLSDSREFVREQNFAGQPTCQNVSIGPNTYVEK